MVNDHHVSKAALRLSFSIGDEFNFHSLAGSCTKSAKLDPSLYHFQTDMELCSNLLWAAQVGDLSTLIYLRNLGFNLNCADYDHRNAAHVAAANGQKKALKYLHKNGCEIGEKDRWGHLPLDDAERNSHDDVAQLLRRWMRTKMNSSDACRTPSVSESIGNLHSQSAGSAQKSNRSSAPVAAKMSVQSLCAVTEEEEEEDDDDDDSESQNVSSRMPSKDSCGWSGSANSV